MNLIWQAPFCTVLQNTNQSKRRGPVSGPSPHHDYAAKRVFSEYGLSARIAQNLTGWKATCDKRNKRRFPRSPLLIAKPVTSSRPLTTIESISISHFVMFPHERKGLQRAIAVETCKRVCVLVCCCWRAMMKRIIIEKSYMTRKTLRKNNCSAEQLFEKRKADPKADLP